MTQIATPTVEEFSKADLVSLVYYQQETIRSQREKLQWYEHNTSNKALPINMRATTYAVKKMIEQEEPREDGYYRADLTTLARIAGTSPSTVSRGLHNLDELTNVLDLRTEEDPHDQRIKLLYIRPTELLERPQEIEPIRPVKKHGGARDRCKCGGEIKTHRHVVKAQEYRQCAKCMTYYEIYPVQDVAEPWEPTEREPLHHEMANQTQEEWNAPYYEEPGEEAPFHLETVPPVEQSLQNDMQSIQVPPIADCNASLSASEIEGQAAQLLLAIAGEHISHVQMCKDGEAKYFTIDRPLDLGDMRTHLRGYKTKGLRLRSIDGQTRAVWIEGDTPEQWEVCQRAARLLAIVGFKVLLIPSPTTGDHKGGGHMWVIFDGLVDAYSAYRTLLQYAPELATCKEYWPGGGVNVRLPGGKYVFHCNAWCDLYSAHGERLTQEGAGLARALLDNQSDSSLVNFYEKPAPAPIAEPKPTPRAPQGGYLEKDVTRAVIDEFNSSHSWPELLGEPNRQGKYAASWRGDRTPNVAINPKTDLAKDFSTDAWLTTSMDKYQAYCLIEDGVNWQEFKKRDLAERCEEYRQRFAPYPPEPRTTVCCNAGWHWNGEKYVCAQCRGKQERKAS